MKRHTVRSIDIESSYSKSFEYIAEPHNLPAWSNAFKKVEGKQALMVSPKGEVEITLEVQSNSQTGDIDWKVIFADGKAADVFSRLVEVKSDLLIYTFILPAPPVPPERLEGILENQGTTLETELRKLKGLLEDGVY